MRVHKQRFLVFLVLIAAISFAVGASLWVWIGPAGQTATAGIGDPAEAFVKVSNIEELERALGWPAKKPKFASSVFPVSVLAVIDTPIGKASEMNWSDGNSGRDLGAISVNQYNGVVHTDGEPFKVGKHLGQRQVYTMHESKPFISETISWIDDGQTFVVFGIHGREVSSDRLLEVALSLQQ
jgi:hypothetical protein